MRTAGFRSHGDGFLRVVMQHMAEAGMTFEPVEVCHFQGRIGNAILRLTVMQCPRMQIQLDLFVSLYAGADELVPVPDAETRTAMEQCAT